jgi:hypothetical protein
MQQELYRNHQEQPPRFSPPQLLLLTHRLGLPSTKIEMMTRRAA